jgi:hypothetical protein
MKTHTLFYRHPDRILALGALQQYPGSFSEKRFLSKLYSS